MLFSYTVSEQLSESQQNLVEKEPSRPASPDDDVEFDPEAMGPRGPSECRPLLRLAAAACDGQGDGVISRMRDPKTEYKLHCCVCYAISPWMCPLGQRCLHGSYVHRRQDP